MIGSQASYRAGFVDACLNGSPSRASAWYGKLTEVVKEVIRPSAGDVDRNKSYPRASVKALRDIGAFGVSASEAHGGLDLGNAMAALTVETVASGCASVAAILMFHLQVLRRVEHFEHPFYCQSDLGRLATGEWLASSAWTESGAGADKTSLQTTMSREGDHWVINGEKHYCSGLEGARLFHVLLGVPDKEGKFKPTFARVEADASGVDVSEIYDLMGLRASSTGAVKLKGVRVDDASIVGDIGQGMELMQINHRSLMNPALLALGSSHRALEEARDTVIGRTDGFRDITGFQNTRFRIAEAESTLAQVYAYAAETVRKVVRGDPDLHIECTKVKLQATEAAVVIADICLRLAGGRGFNAAFAFERHLRDAYATVLMGPSNEVIKERASNHFFAMPPMVPQNEQTKRKA